MVMRNKLTKRSVVAIAATALIACGDQGLGVDTPGIMGAAGSAGTMPTAGMGAPPSSAVPSAGMGVPSGAAGQPGVVNVPAAGGGSPTPSAGSGAMGAAGAGGPMPGVAD